MSISDSSLVHLTDSTLNNVGRDQINHIIQHITTQAVNVRNITTAVTSDDEDYSEYTTVKRGDMFIVKKVQSEEVEDRRWDGTKGILSAQGKKTLYTVEVHGKKFTAATYSGWNTHKLWKRDYFSYSSQLDESCIQLFGINTSIPALIFHHELIPFSQVVHKTMFWEELSIIFAEVIRKPEGSFGHQFQTEPELLLDTSTGNLCSAQVSGQTFLICSDYRFGSVATIIPSAIDMVRQNTAYKFLTNQGSVFDYPVLNHALWGKKYHSFNLPFNSDYNGLRFDTIYLHSQVEIARFPAYVAPTWDLFYTWENSWFWGLDHAMKIEGNGLLRFVLMDLCCREVGMCSINVRVHFRSWCYSHLIIKAWLSQAAGIMDGLSTSKYSGDYFIPYLPSISLETQLHSKSCGQQHQMGQSKPQQTIYLFVYPLPYPLTCHSLEDWRNGCTHFWSFDKAGQSKISEEEQKHLQIPKLTPHISYICEKQPCNHFYSHFGKLSWDSYVYDSLQQWQIARGFDSTTAEYAQSLGIPELEILYNNQKDTHNASGTVAGHTEEIDQMVGQDLHNGEGGNTKPERTGNSCQTLQKGKGKGKALDLGGSTNCSKYVKKKASTVVEQSATGSAPPSHQPHVIKPSTRVQNRDLGGNSTQKKATSITKKSAMGLASPSYHEPHAAAIKPFPRTRDQESNLESLNKRPRQQQQQTLKPAWR